MHQNKIDYILKHNSIILKSSNKLWGNSSTTIDAYLWYIYYYCRIIFVKITYCPQFDETDYFVKSEDIWSIGINNCWTVSCHNSFSMQFFFSLKLMNKFIIHIISSYDHKNKYYIMPCAQFSSNLFWSKAFRPILFSFIWFSSMAYFRPTCFCPNTKLVQNK